MQALLQLKSLAFSRKYFYFLLKFIFGFLVLYYGSVFLYGLSIPGGFYSSIVARYFPVYQEFGKGLLIIAKAILSVLGYEATMSTFDNLRIGNNPGIYLHPGCLGFAVISFWFAFVFANNGSFKKKSLWIVIGFFFITIVNITRLSLLVVALSKGKSMPLGLDHHTFFNILSYLFVFLLMYVYDRNSLEKN